LDEAEKDVATILHEVTHILGFSGSAYPWYQDYDLNFRGEDNVITKNNKGEYFIKTPRLLELAKQYYGCDDIDGMPLENDGGSGSKGAHWERSLFGDEFMTA
jgi:hypothetical protein